MLAARAHAGPGKSWRAKVRSRITKWLAMGLLLAGACDVKAQTPGQPVTTQPSSANSGEGSGTIAASNVFQQIFPATTTNGTGATRKGCAVQNVSADEQFVYFQGPGMVAPTAGNSSSLEAKAFALDPTQVSGGKQGGSVSCATGAGGVLQDSVWIAGTIGDNFVAKQQ